MQDLFRKLGLRPHDHHETINLDRATHMSWGEVQSLVRTSYQRQGYVVESAARSQAPVDMVLTRGDDRVFLECRHWGVWQVPDKAVHELAGYASGAGADHAIMITTGRFSDQARAYAATRGMELVDGGSLPALVAGSPSRS
jgi:restriction system protein